MKKANKNLF